MTYRPNQLEIENNPIWAYLEASEIPWLETKQSLIERFGVSEERVSKRRKITIAHSANVFKKMYLDLSFTDSAALLYLPPSEFDGIFKKIKPTASEEFDYWQAQVSKILGPPTHSSGADIDTINTNVFRCEWHYPPARLQLIIWPKILQDKNTTYAWIDRKREEACHVKIETGLTSFASPQDLAEFAGSSALELPYVIGANYQARASAYIRQSPFWRSFRDQDRERDIHVVQPDSPIQLYISRDKESLFLLQDCGFQRCDVNRIEKVAVGRILPAKGGGGSYLYLKLKPDLSEGQTCTIASCSHPDGFNTIAETLAKALNCPYELGEYQYDC